MSSFFGKFLTILGLRKREANILVVGLDNSGKSTILNYLKRKEEQVEEIVPTVGFNVEKLNGIENNRSGLSLTAFDMSGQGRYRNLWEHYYDSVEGIVFVVDSTDSLRLVVAKDELEMLLKYQNIETSFLNESADSNSEDYHHTNSNNKNDEEKDDDENRITDHHQNLEKLDNDEEIWSTESIKNATNMNNNHHQMETTNTPKHIPILFFANKMDLRNAISAVNISQTLGLNRLPHKQWHVQASNALTGEGLQQGIEWLILQISNNKKIIEANVKNSSNSGSSR